MYDRIRVFTWIILCVASTEVCAGPVEATAIGNILLLALNKGHVASIQEAREVVRNSFDVETFEPGDAGPWDDAYTRFAGIAEKAAQM